MGVTFRRAAHHGDVGPLAQTRVEVCKPANVHSTVTVISHSTVTAISHSTARSQHSVKLDRLSVHHSALRSWGEQRGFSGVRCLQIVRLWQMCNRRATEPYRIRPPFSVLHVLCSTVLGEEDVLGLDIEVDLKTRIRPQPQHPIATPESDHNPRIKSQSQHPIVTTGGGPKASPDPDTTTPTTPTQRHRHKGTPPPNARRSARSSACCRPRHTIPQRQRVWKQRKGGSGRIDVEVIAPCPCPRAGTLGHCRCPPSPTCQTWASTPSPQRCGPAARRHLQRAAPGRTRGGGGGGGGRLDEDQL